MQHGCSYSLCLAWIFVLILEPPDPGYNQRQWSDQENSRKSDIVHLNELCSRLIYPKRKKLVQRNPFIDDEALEVDDDDYDDDDDDDDDQDDDDDDNDDDDDEIME